MLRPIGNLQKYRDVMNKQVLQYLCAQMSDWKQTNKQLLEHLKIRIQSNQKLLRVSEGTNLLVLPLQDPAFMFSHAVMIDTSSKYSSVFLETAVEILQILNENFPSHFQFKDNLHSSKEERIVMEAEQHRRHVSFLNSFAGDKRRQFSPDEVRDILYVLRECHHMEDYNGISLCLTLLERDLSSSFEFLKKPSQKASSHFEQLPFEDSDALSDTKQELTIYIKELEQLISQSLESGLRTHSERATTILKYLLVIYQGMTDFITVEEQEETL